MRFHVRAAILLLAALPLACVDDDGLLAPVGPAGGAEPATAKDPGGPARWIVVLRDDVPDVRTTVDQLAGLAGAEVHHTYRSALRGFAATLTPAMADALRQDPRVAYVQLDGMMEMMPVQANAPWGLDRIDQRTGLSTTYSYTRTGAGVTVYVIDSGIVPTHVEFGGRASIGGDFLGGNGLDCNGHGTHVAGTIGGATFGVAKAVDLVALRVFGCSGGTPSSVIVAAIDWVTANADRPAVVNMSLGGPPDAAIDAAVANSIASGITYVLSAGNSGTDACTFSPARVPQAITVGASTQQDLRVWFSNWGPCVDIFAPGENIPSAWWTSNTAAALLSGTSMASPHVAGVAALWLQNHPGASPSSVAGRIRSSGSANRIGELPIGTRNLFAYSSLGVQAGGRVALNRSSVEFVGFTAGPPVFEVPQLFGSRRVEPVAQESAARRGRAPTTMPQTRVHRAPTDRWLEADDAPLASPTPDLQAAPTAPQTVRLTNAGNDTLRWTATRNAPWITVSPSSGSLAPGAAVSLRIRGVPDQLEPGLYEGLVRVSGGVGGSSYVGVSLGVLLGGQLQDGIATPAIWDVLDGVRFYRIVVPQGATQLRVAITGAGDADLYVRNGAPPTFLDFVCRPFLNGSVETCILPSPPAGEWWVMLYGYAAYSGVSLLATVSP